MRWTSASDIAAGVRTGRIDPIDVVENALGRIAESPDLNAFTDLVAERARARARSPLKGPLAGVPFAVKNMFDISGLPTRAGSAINRFAKHADRDAVLIERLENAGAILVGAVNMSEFAYEFSGANAHDGTPRNPHDLDRMAGGSSSGSATAVAGGLVPLSLASDTNGSIRVPASFCGLFGMKPTFGRLSRSGSFPLATSLDHLGLLTRSAADLALAYDVLQGPAEGDPTCAGRVEFVSHQIDEGVDGLRIAVAGGYFEEDAAPEVLAAVQKVAQALKVVRHVDIPGAARARASAYLITASEAAALHLERLRSRAAEFGPSLRGRLIAGALVPAAIVSQAQKCRRLFQQEMRDLFEDIDVLLAPAAPCVAPPLDTENLMLRSRAVSLRAHLGVYTQPIGFVGLPVASVPVLVDGMPLGIQVVTAPWREDLALRVARNLERAGICGSRPLANSF